MRAAFVACASNQWLLEDVVITITTVRASEAANDTINQRILINNQFNDMVERAVAGRKEAIQKRNLRCRAGIAVEDQTFGRRDGVHMFAEDFRHKLIRKQLPRFHDFVSHFANVGSGFDSRAQNVASRQLHHAIFLDEKRGLSSLACTRRSQKDDIHETFPRSFRCRTT